jgi:hypothetical protein
MKQQNYSIVDFERYRMLIRREKFLDEMDDVVPWEQ